MALANQTEATYSPVMFSKISDCLNEYKWFLFDSLPNLLCTAGNAGVDGAAEPCVDKKDDDSKFVEKNVSETAEEKPPNTKSALTPVDKAKTDVGGGQSGEKCDKTTPKNGATDISKDVTSTKPNSDTPGLEMEVNSISDSDCDSDVSNLVIDLNKERDNNQSKRMTISVAGDTRDSAFVIDLDKDDEMKADVKTSHADFGKVHKVAEHGSSRSEQLGSKKPVKFKSERQKEIERQQR